MKSQYRGTWLISEMESWDADFINLVGQGYLTIGWNSSGFMQFGAVELDLDWRAEDTGGIQRLEFSMQGFDEGNPVSGRGWATVCGLEMTGRIYLHKGEESGFTAIREKKRRTSTRPEINARISQAWGLSDHRDGWKMALPISRELDQVLTSIQSLIALGRTEEARDTLWQEFTKGLGLYTFEEVLELTPEEQKDTLHRKAVSLAEQYRSPEQGAYFLVQVNELERAARVIEQRQDEISGSWYSSLSEVAHALADSYPSQARLVCRSLLLDILNSARYKAYSHGAKYLTLMERLAEKATLRSRQAEFIQMLRQKHGRKSSFWAKAKLGAQ
jgi:hypothetical protein